MRSQWQSKVGNFILVYVPSPERMLALLTTY